MSKFFEAEFSHIKDAKKMCLECQGYLYEKNPDALSTAVVNRSKTLVKESLWKSGRGLFYM